MSGVHEWGNLCFPKSLAPTVTMPLIKAAALMLEHARFVLQRNVLRNNVHSVSLQQTFSDNIGEYVVQNVSLKKAQIRY